MAEIYVFMIKDKNGVPYLSMLLRSKPDSDFFVLNGREYHQTQGQCWSERALFPKNSEPACRSKDRFGLRPRVLSPWTNSSITR